MSTESIEKKARKILGVPDDADVKMIRQAYRELAKKYHPDINPNDRSLPKRFILITEAYEILSSGKNAGRHSGLSATDDIENRPPFGEKLYWDWWKERFGNLF
ncbi:chaperone protein DnaJ [Desulfosporosinus acididurans]|uniref:Chaperone protein DnaJ n=1 Tax=Desulfosporosinus acididurans TaxID=476652 RepID=A0A0J1FQH3_9FIRM|nr:J domain-containing protein [Desulfosporosinus acididurans]KLU65755.1 chaperone protein DnaJ [Desulfosporosinus acididurans]